MVGHQKQTKRARERSERAASASAFNDPKLEWRRIFAESWGTFLLVVASAGGVLAHDAFPDKVSYAMALAAASFVFPLRERRTD